MGDWTHAELEAVVDAYLEMNVRGHSWAQVRERFSAGPLASRSTNSIRRRLQHVRLIQASLQETGAVETVVSSTKVGTGVAETIAAILHEREPAVADHRSSLAEPATVGDWYFINTDAASLGGTSPHDIWIERGLALTGGPRDYGERLGQFAAGDSLFMWANGIGTVAVGRVLEAWDGEVYEEGLVYPPGTAEYRVSVHWHLDLRSAPIPASALGFNPRGAVEHIREPRRSKLEAVLATRLDPTRVWWAPRYVPDTEVYADALKQLESSTSNLQRQLLLAQYREPERATTSGRLAEVCGIVQHGVVNLHYGGLGRRLGEAMGFRPLWHATDHPEWWNVLSWCPRREPFVWQMQPPLASALEQLGWVDPTDAAAADEIADIATTYAEGASKRIVVNAYERDRRARDACVAHHGHTCVVCGFDFERVYGNLGARFIHVHHVRPVSTLGPGYTVDPKTDLVPVCPNCHAMLHRQSPPLTPAQLRAQLRR